MYCHDKYSIFREGFGKGFADKFKNSNVETTCLIVYTAVWQTFFILYHMNYKSCFQQEGVFSEYCEIITVIVKIEEP